MSSESVVIERMLRMERCYRNALHRAETGERLGRGQGSIPACAGKPERLGWIAKR